MIKEQRKKKKKFVKILKILFTIIFILAIAFLIAFKVFTVENVEVEGNVLYDEETIKNAVLYDDYSWNSLYVFVKYKFIKTKEIPFIDTMAISLKNPHTLHIKVYEKGRLGYVYVPEMGINAYFDKDGLVVETSEEKINDVPMINGIDCKTVELYEKLPIDDDNLRDILTLTQSLKRNKMVPESITYGVKNEPVVSYGNVMVVIGDTTALTQKIARLEAIMPSIEGQNGTLHLEDWSEESTNIVFDRK